MDTLEERIRTRLIPAILTALGVSFVAAGLLTYGAVGAADGSSASVEPTIIGSFEASLSASPISFPTIPPLTSPSPGPSASLPPIDRLATRVVVPALDIDLPVVKPSGGTNTFPLCNVAMYIQELHQPGEPGATYIYAHARTGMFLPILDASKIDNGKRMLGMIVQVYTSDDMLFLYEITQVRRHQTSLDAAFATTEETLWLQTSEGPRGTIQKVQLVAKPISVSPADHADAHPKPHPVVCY